MADPFKFLNSINFEKTNLLEDDEASVRDYVPFMINRGLSYFSDTIMHANEMNMSAHLDKDMQYMYLLHAINKRKRFSKWSKKTTSENLELIKEVYAVNNQRAAEILKLLSSNQIETIKREQYKGGMKK